MYNFRNQPEPELVRILSMLHAGHTGTSYEDDIFGDINAERLV